MDRRSLALVALLSFVVATVLATVFDARLPAAAAGERRAGSPDVRR